MERGNNLVLPILGALVAAVLGAVLWTVVGVSTEREVGYVALGVGALTGFAVQLLANKRTTRVHQIIAAVAAAIGVLLGKYFLFAYVGNDGFDGMFNSYTFSMFQEMSGEIFDALDILFLALAVVPAWRIAAPKTVQPIQPQQSTPVE
ncbi:hypothetical protein EJP77_12055 [Paenibacillus zeisoli]|uniref:Uncharacterized protein n=1 Tax=Paenibacillus zeisoli TaxID=2496267 RepID=A0A433X8Y6_9BACL|nr:hypothetical protein [Paenibacillus zeisoli]RUT30556.1 hypothetical protein EJP77_12055 [Paenibacillus zeisoli]